MERLVPLMALEHDTQAVVAVDEHHAIRLANRAARRLLGLAPTNSLPSHCWLLASFRSADGSPFCGPDCPVQQAARDGHAGAQHWVVGSHGPTAGRMIELVSFFVKNGFADRTAVLHFLRPISVSAPEPVRTGRCLADRALAPVCGLTKREEEVLAKVAEGLSTAAIARSLGIATTTVRNHIQSILRKMGVHRRIEAVVAFAGAVATATKP